MSSILPSVPQFCVLVLAMIDFPLTKVTIKLSEAEAKDSEIVFGILAKYFSIGKFLVKD